MLDADADGAQTPLRPAQVEEDTSTLDPEELTALSEESQNCWIFHPNLLEKDVYVRLLKCTNLLQEP